MKKLVSMFLMFSLAFTAMAVVNCVAAEAAPTVTTPIVATPEAPQLVAPWLQGLIGIIVTIIGTFVLPYLKQASVAAQSAAALNQVNINASLLDQRAALLAQVKAYLFEQADTIATDRWPIIAAGITSGRLANASAVKAELYAWGEELKKNAIAHFSQNGIDIVKLLGTSAIDDMVSLAANKTSPFPGKEAAVEVLKTNIVPLLVQNGVNWVRDHYLTNGATPEVEAVTLPTSREMGQPARVIYRVVKLAA
jgi:hypothetical protein